MFDRIARRYDLLNRLLSLGADQCWRMRAVEALALCGEVRVLDVGTGTADLAIAIAKRFAGARVVGVDPSPRMLALARMKCCKAGLA
ncbi:MAG: class I SAM-dependent methyltransferase, partial [Candidatus Methanomethylicaceae archaeon]